MRHAENHDWSIEQKKPKKGHTWGRAISPDGEIKIRIDGTPKNPGDRAKNIRRAVDRYEKDKSS